MIPNCTKRVACVMIAVGVSMTPAMNAGAQGYPARTVRIIDVFPPGGSTDVVARVVAAKLSPAFGQSFVIENRPGAAGNLGAEIAAKSAPDGHTLLIGLSIGMAASATLYPNLSYDALRDFAPVARAGTSTYLLVTHPSLPVRAVKDLVALAKSRPGQLHYASAGTASGAHLSGELLKSRSGINLVHVPYKGGAPSVTAVMSGETETGFMSVASSVTQVRAGKLRALAIASARRSSALPDVATIAESGFPGFDVSPSVGFYAPAGTPADIVARLSAEVQKAVAQADVRERFLNVGVESAPASGAELSALLKEEIVKWAKVIKDAGIRAD